MKAKSIVTTILVLFVVACVIVIFTGEIGNNSEVVSEAETAAERDLRPAENASAAAGDARHKIIAYYFHGNVRCQTCRRIEAFSKEALDTAFMKEMKTGNLEWRLINIEEPQYQHFVQDYDLTTRSLVLSEVKGDKEIKWKNLEKVWLFVGDKETFIEYVQDETASYLESL
jgi:hypothetical protein